MSSASQSKEVRVEVLKARRAEKRKRMEEIFQQHRLIQQQMKEIEDDLENLDDEIDNLELEIQQDQQQQQQAPIVSVRKSDVLMKKGSFLLSPTQRDEILTDPNTQVYSPIQEDFPEEENHFAMTTNASIDSEKRISQKQRQSSRVSIGRLELNAGDPQRRRPPGSSTNREISLASIGAFEPNAGAEHRRRTGTLDGFVSSSTFPRQNSVGGRSDAFSYVPPFAQANQRRTSLPNDFSSDSFPWSQQVTETLRHTFKINSFRDNQKEIINATMTGEDVFVIMRTGGGKSLTYQLPALLEGRGPQKKITFVVSPLLSLIQDQEDQMNKFAGGSAVSFTSGMKGGSSEHARRWGLVRDPSQGVCLVFVTPEKVHQSNKLCSEMEKLHAQGRLGRFVIDEAHCACQWGHDFRQDYLKLGKLKSHFPSIPVIAVTATASMRAKDDVCNILRMDSSYRFFRSTANRPNLTYAVLPKPDGKDAVIQAMANYIQEKHQTNAGIIYTLSKKDADGVAKELCERGISASAYHSDVSATKKEKIHKSWMRNQTQVVVATVAFGLGINKPDVYFVLHHSISKTLEAYYQESGRAGRDGKAADCVLYYSPKDAHRMLKMVHGTTSEQLLWPMIRYAQQTGNDAVCRASLMNHLGEPDFSDLAEVCRRNEGITSTQRDVGRHAQTAVLLLRALRDEGRDITSAMLVKEWRAKGEKAAPVVTQNPPSQDGLSADDCERIVVALILEGVLKIAPQWTRYDTIIYLDLVPGVSDRFVSTQSTRFMVDFPIRPAARKDATSSKGAKQAKSRKSLTKEDGWISSKRKPVKRKSGTKKKPAKKKAKSSSKTKAASAITLLESARLPSQQKPTEVIELSSDDESVKPSLSREDVFLSETDEEEWDG